MNQPLILAWLAETLNCSEPLQAANVSVEDLVSVPSQPEKAATRLTLSS